MRTSSATGRGPARHAKRPAKVIPLPTPRFVRRKRLMRLAVALAVAALAIVMAARLFIARATLSHSYRVQEPRERGPGILPMAYHALRVVPRGGTGIRALSGV